MVSFPLNVNEPAVTADALDQLYILAAGAPTGGMYPVGANNLWHGGVHLSLGEEPPVYASAPGRIVAARLDPDPERATCTYGHTNFILTKHTWPPQTTKEDGTPYYMLYMHLAPRPLEAVAQTAGAVPWLTEKPLRRVTAESGLAVRYRPRLGKKDAEGAVPHGRLVKPLGEPTEQNGYRWQEVEVLRQDLEGYVALGPLGERGDLREQWTEEAPPPGGSDLVGTLESGNVAALDMPIDAGEMLWWSGHFGQDLGDWAIDDELFAELFGLAEPIERAPTLHWEVFSFEKAFGLEENGSGRAPAPDEETGGLSMPNWTAKEDSGTALTFNQEESDAFSLIKKVRAEAPDLPDPDDYATLSMGEKKSLHYLDTGKKLRTYAVKYASEWGLGADGIKKALEESPVHDPERDKADFEAFQFWKEVEELPSANLPGDAKVWHYHPVTVLRALAATGYSSGPHSASDRALEMG